MGGARCVGIGHVTGVLSGPRTGGAAVLLLLDRRVFWSWLGVSDSHFVSHHDESGVGWGWGQAALLAEMRSGAVVCLHLFHLVIYCSTSTPTHSLSLPMHQHPPPHHPLPLFILTVFPSLHLCLHVCSVPSLPPSHPLIFHQKVSGGL